MQRRHLAILGSCLVSGALLWFAVRGVEWHKVGAELQKLDLRFTPLAVLLFVAYYVVKAVRWRLLMPKNDASLGVLYDTVMIGALGNTVLPLRAGEFLRPWALSVRSDVPFSTAFASVVTERVFDVIALLLLLGASLRHVPELPAIVVAGAQALGILAGGLGLVMILSYVAADRVLSFVQYLAKRATGTWFEKAANAIEHKFEEFVVGLRAIKSGKELAIIIVLSLLLWFITSMFYQVLLWSMGEFPSLWVGIVLNVIIAFAVAAPSAPGFIGAFQAGCVIALATSFNYSEEFALGFSLIAHVAQFVLTIAAGAYSIRRLGFGARQLLNSTEQI